MLHSLFSILHSQAELGLVGEGAVGVELEVVVGPEFFVGAGGADFPVSGGDGVDEEWGLPAVGDFSGGVEGGVVVREEALAVGVCASEGVGEVGVAADGEVCVFFDEGDVAEAEAADGLEVVAECGLW